MRLKPSLLMATLLATPVVATAQPFQGVYIGAGAGGNFAETQSSTQGTRLRTDPGFVGLASIGYGFGNGLRLELEGNYRENNGSRFIDGTRSFRQDGPSVRKYGGMANALFDIDVGSPYIFPYVGAGIGGINTELGNDNYNQANLAYQAIAGSSFPIPGVPGLSLTAEYRFLGQDGVQKKSEFFVFPTSNSNLLPGASTAVNITPFRIRQQFDHSLLLGVRYAFGVTPPPSAAPVPVAVQAPAHSYLVFFDWDRADLTDRARQIIGQAAQNSQKVSYTRVEVNGYTDTSGTPAYNQRLSVRRADAVAAELVRDGVPRAAIAIQGFGETRLLVPTADGVREPQNRRVEIIIR